MASTIRKEPRKKGRVQDSKKISLRPLDIKKSNRFHRMLTIVKILSVIVRMSPIMTISAKMRLIVMKKVIEKPGETLLILLKIP